MIELLSDSPTIIAGAIRNAITNNISTKAIQRAKEGVRYYNFEHDILNNRIFYVDDNNSLAEDKYASNVKIPHSFLNELIDQKTQYLLSNPVDVSSDDDELNDYLKEYYTDDMQLTLQELVEGASQKGFEYAYARTTSEDKLMFQVADSLQVIPVYDSDNNVQRILRYYTDTIVKDRKQVKLTFAELYDAEKVWCFVAEDSKAFKLDPSQPVNPRSHVLAIADNEQTDEQRLAGRSYGVIPFYRLSNNKAERTDLEPIKALIDDYDLMDAFMSNNLQDFADAIYVVKGFQGDDLSTLRQNIKAKKSIGVGEGGDVSIQTVNIPTEARKTKLELDRENIYKFGFGYDSSQVGDGNVTNVVIKGRYTLLNMKANKTEVRLRSFIAWANKLIIDDINRRYNKTFDVKQLTVTITREMLINENDLANNDKVRAETRSTDMQTLLAVAPRLDDETVLKQITDAYDLDFEEVKAKLGEQDYSQAPVPKELTGGEDDGAEG